MTPKPRVKVPDRASRGEIIEVRTLISHEMETGLRIGQDGNPIPRKIIHRFDCKYNGETVFSTELGPAVSANPYLEFNVVASESGEFEFIWYEDGGAIYTEKARITVS
jgi:sulfur-oxidizing protein SoxZ